METRWLHVTSENFASLREASRGVCVIPVGAVEKHGLHLPLGTDALISEGVVYEASKLEEFCVFPTFVFGDMYGKFPSMPDGTVTLSVELEMRLLEELCEQISKNGFKKILIFNGHGGNGPWLATFLRRLGNRKRDYVAATYFTWECAPHELAKYLLENGPGSIPELTPEDEKYLLECHEKKMLVGHACMGESAPMLALFPEDVHFERFGIEDGHSTHAADHLNKAGIKTMDGGWELDYPNFYCADDHPGCTVSIGRAALRFQAERFAAAVKVLKDDDFLLAENERRNAGWQ
ncbi:MAG: creatininase family protein [Clostridia bacterium]|nr:creatininase family protein [Clostridia bacterium]